MTENQAKTIANELLAIEAVTLNPVEPFTWASGLRAPIYTDNRLIVSHPETRTKVAQEMAATIRKQFPEAEVIAGTATAGIPHASIVAHLLGLPMVYVRSGEKDHGKKNVIEGEFKKGAKVVMIEDLISTGQSVISAAEFVEDYEGEVIGCVAIFNYLLNQSKVAFEQVDYPLVTLTDYQTLVDVATEAPELIHYKETLEEWYQDPVLWSDQFASFI